jgi:uncharacterized membrane protein YeaQ/YmgE (transglycosylase-associated protein family)
MFSRVLRFVRMPLVLLVIWAALRFLLGPVFHVPYEPRGNAMISVLGLTIISCLYFGAMSRRVGDFNWVGTILVGVVIGLWAQILIFLATLVSFAANVDTYYTHWDALNIPKDTHATMAQALTTRAGGLIAGPILGIIAALIGRAVFSALAPKCGDDR